MKRLKRATALILSAVLLLSVLSGCGEQEQTPSDWQAQYDLGAGYLAKGKYEEAALAFSAAISIDSSAGSAYLGLAESYKAQGETSMAIKTLRRAIDKVEGKDELAEIRERLAELEAAVPAETPPVETAPVETPSGPATTPSPTAGRRVVYSVSGWDNDYGQGGDTVFFYDSEGNNIGKASYTDGSLLTRSTSWTERDGMGNLTLIGSRSFNRGLYGGSVDETMSETLFDYSCENGIPVSVAMTIKSEINGESTTVEAPFALSVEADSAGRVTAILVPGGESPVPYLTWEYDDAGNMIRCCTYGNGDGVTITQETLCEYYPSGRLLCQTSRSHFTEYTYEEVNAYREDGQLSRKTVCGPDGSVMNYTFHFNAAGYADSATGANEDGEAITMEVRSMDLSDYLSMMAAREADAPLNVARMAGSWSVVTSLSRTAEPVGRLEIGTDGSLRFYHRYQFGGTSGQSGEGYELSDMRVQMTSATLSLDADGPHATGYYIAEGDTIYWLWDEVVQGGGASSAGGGTTSGG